MPRKQISLKPSTLYVAIRVNYRSGGKYGFVDKVIDGIFVHINSVTVQFNSQKFEANLQV